MPNLATTPAARPIRSFAACDGSLESASSERIRVTECGPKEGSAETIRSRIAPRSGAVLSEIETDAAGVPDPTVFHTVLEKPDLAVRRPDQLSVNGC